MVRPRRGSPLALLTAVVAAVATLFMLQRCFMVPAVSAPPASPTASFGMSAPSLAGEQGLYVVAANGDSLELGASMPFAGAGLETGVREINVAMFNKKRTRFDRSEGWTNRKKFRTCSLMARAATNKGKKILKRQIRKGKHKLGPGDYTNPKMQPVKPLR
ncbi:unnamed protein product [Polarella glacialis]|uniref:Uncharacterized protein n=1 Tax=Polarella glacialis TaxID=89957 RepID=A0A813JM84_POLGL|nr:unnamed protein product [Polarella glacialis]CAE8678590.1 unnamed protein product [Polarella glacialis]